MNDIVRQPRNSEKREATERPKAWAPPALLPDPVPEAGFAFRWVRVATQNQADPTNISSKFREGWEPVPARSQPHMQMFTGNNPKYPDAIEIGGLMLCKCPAEFMDQREAYYQKQAEAQMASVDNNFMRESDARMPLFKERQSEVKFGKGT
jgi:hypothetical protein